MLEGPFILKMDPAEMAEAATTPIPEPAGQARRNTQEFRRKLEKFYVDEGVVATFDRGGDNDMAAGGSDLSWQQQHTDGGTIFPAGSEPRDANAGRNVPAITLAVEHYNRMIRVLDKGVPVKVDSERADEVLR